jgi:hypothetical protein
LVEKAGGSFGDVRNERNERNERKPYIKIYYNLHIKNVIFTYVNKPTPLCGIMCRNKSDKGSVN